MYVITKINNGFKKVQNYIRCSLRRKKLRNKDFTIISNNCWAGFIYQKYGLQYKTPTIGLFFIGNDYIKFCKKLKYYVNQDLKFISFSESKNYDLIKGDREYPIARLDDIKIYFMHYKTEKEAKEKWYRRCKRINYDSLIFKVSQREGFTKQDMEEFMDIENKCLICFSHDKINGSICVPELEMLEGDETELLQKYFDDLDYLNNI